MSIVGKWTLEYDWGCEGEFSLSVIVFNADGTIENEGLAGRWVEAGGMVAWRYDIPGAAKYFGHVFPNTMAGGFFSFVSRGGGCWRATRAEGERGGTRHKAKYDVAGLEVKREAFGDS